MHLNPGERVGNYRVECELGTSGSGLLLQAQHVVLPRRAIIKVILTGFATEQPLVVQTLREASILEAIAHPGVPILYEAGCLQDHRPWFAFEENNGPTLDELLASGPLPATEVAALVHDIAAILEHAHHRGVIHRGLRPNRIVITVAGRYPLCIPDWSEAILYDAATAVRRWVSEASRSYVAPELLRCDDSSGTENVIDDRVDVFALGVIAHRALTGRLPFAPGLGAEPYAPSHEWCPDAPRALTELIDSMLAFERLDRPSAAEARARAEQLFDGAPQPSMPVAVTGEAAPAVPSLPVSPEDLVALAQRQYVRRPRWTPAIRYAEATDGATVSEDDGPDDFMM